MFYSVSDTYLCGSWYFALFLQLLGFLSLCVCVLIDFNSIFISCTISFICLHVDFCFFMMASIFFKILFISSLYATTCASVWLYLYFFESFVSSSLGASNNWMSINLLFLDSQAPLQLPLLSCDNVFPSFASSLQSSFLPPSSHSHPPFILSFPSFPSPFPFFLFLLTSAFPFPPLSSFLLTSFCQKYFLLCVSLLFITIVNSQCKNFPVLKTCLEGWL